ncbi:DUF177 domain-containing protein [Paenibacillus athensensis]|uniref:DUF177 domain-containing protein n=1 Tax=Paenibacillus athensensis TaxID=1967502 RepID=A0A4Y8PWT6_9BACL|nr:YceD family protein [Paenibacillus athensensis]MCD1257870.1 DUF177 domain-containing protein [Paenibacillus athensensis]
MMRLHLKDLVQKGHAVQLQEDMPLDAAFAGRSDIVAHGPVHVELHAQHEDGIVKVGGTLAVDLELSCSRCLSHVRQKLELPFQEGFALQPVAGADPEEDIHVVNEDTVELAPFIEENVVVGLPYISLCQDDCQGLCPVCGANRNQHDCGCKQEKIDPRLAGLADFFKEQ